MRIAFGLSMMLGSVMDEQAAEIPSPASLAGEGEGEGTLQLGRGGARELARRLANRNPHLNPLPRVMRERRPFHIAVVSRSVVRSRARRPGPNQPLEATAARCGAFGLGRRFTRRASAATRSA